MDLLKKHNSPKVIDYISIDTEGSEWEIIKNFDFDKYTFLTITIEHNYYRKTHWDKKEKIKRDKIRKLLLGKNYILHTKQSNEDWWINSKLKKRR